MTGTADLRGQIEAIEEGRDQIESEYKGLLRSIAYNDLTAFAELMHFDEPPALHHMFMCDKLMTLEATPKGRLIIDRKSVV